MKPMPTYHRWAAVALALACALGLSTSAQAADQVTNQREKSRSTPEQDEILKWNLKTLVQAYDEVGSKNPKWDSAARRALTEFANVLTFGSVEDRLWEMRQDYEQAVNAGCDDPLVEYLGAYLGNLQDTRTRVPTNKAQLRSVADRLFESRYPAIRKFFAASRAGARDRTRTGSAFALESAPYREKAQKYFVQVLEDKTTPLALIYGACRGWFNGLQGDDEAMEQALKAVEPLFERYSTNAFVQHRIKGIYYWNYGWGARGSGLSFTVSEKGWDSFGKRLKLATEELEAAWKLNPDESIATDMMTVELGLGKGKDHLDLWFQRAMKLNPDSYDACLNKLTYLEPKWYGSTEEMLAFARQCALSTNYGGQVALILDKAHETASRYLSEPARTDYWKKEEIWKEIKAAYDKYYRTSTLPDTASRSKLLLVAYRTRQWPEFLSLHSQMKSVDYSLFGGMEQFKKIHAYAKSKADQPKPAQ